MQAIGERADEAELVAFGPATFEFLDRCAKAEIAAPRDIGLGSDLLSERNGL